MLMPAIDFVLAPIQDLHQDRTSPIHTVLKAGSAPAHGAATVYCLAHHALEGVETAARAKDTATFDRYRAHPDANASALSTPTVVGLRVVVSPGPDGMLRSPLSETRTTSWGPTLRLPWGSSRNWRPSRTPWAPGLGSPTFWLATPSSPACCGART